MVLRPGGRHRPLWSQAAAPSELPLLLVGPSGAGKSSVLRAGLVPQLAEQPGGGPAAVYDLTVTGVAELAHVVLKLTAESERPGEAGAADGERRTVVVDQFEAVFTLCDDEEERSRLIGKLCELAHSALVVLALRADFYGQAIRYPGLRQALQERHVVLGPMTEGQVRDAIVQPARLARADVDEGLVALLLADLAPAGDGGDAAYEPGALPLLSHAMLATWEHHRGDILTVSDYLASGGIKDALTRTAEQAYGSLADDQRELARQLFLRLVHVADEMAPSRASVALADLPGWGQEGDAERVLATFVGERMITVDANAAQITHDALLNAWPRLRAWIEEDTGQLRDRTRILDGAQAWLQAGQEDAALWRGSRLALAREWAADAAKRTALPGQALSFVDKCVAAAEASERAARRRTRVLQSTVAVLAALVLAVAGLSGYAFSQRSAAAAAEGNAVSAAGMANSRDVAFTADQLRSVDPAAAAQLSVSADEFSRTPQATASLLESSGAASVARIDDSSGIVQWVAISPGRRLLAAAGDDGTLRLWNVAAPGRPTLIADLVAADGNDPLYAATFSPDGKLLAAAGAAGVVRLWDVSGTRATPLGRPLTGPASTVFSIAFSPDSSTLAAASTDGTVRLWHVADPARATPDGAPLAHAGDVPELGRVQPRRPDARGRHRGRHGLAVAAARSGRPGRRRRPDAAGGDAAARTGRFGLGRGIQPGRAGTGRVEQGLQDLAVAGRGRPRDPRRRAHRRDQLGEHGGVQPGRPVAGGRHLRRERAGVEHEHAEANRDAAAPAAGHVGGLGRRRPGGRGRRGRNGLAVGAAVDGARHRQRADPARLRARRANARGRRRRQRPALGYRHAHAPHQPLPAADGLRQRDRVPPERDGRGPARGRGLERDGRAAQREHAGAGHALPSR